MLARRSVEPELHRLQVRHHLEFLCHVAGRRGPKCQRNPRGEIQELEAIEWPPRVARPRLSRLPTDPLAPDDFDDRAGDTGATAIDHDAINVAGYRLAWRRRAGGGRFGWKLR